MRRPPHREDRSALRYAYRLLSYRGRSEKELRDRLRMKGFVHASVEEAIEALRAGGFLNDRELASSLKRYAEETKHLGLSGTKKFLRERGIPGEIIDETVSGIDEEETAIRVVEKKLRLLSGAPSEKKARRLYGLLFRRGYSPDTIRKTLERFRLAGG